VIILPTKTLRFWLSCLGSLVFLLTKNFRFWLSC
jgi:hypothetical protein